MARLADEILKGVDIPPWVNLTHPSEGPLLAVLRSCSNYARRAVTFDPVIDVSNVADYTWDQKETWSATNKDQFPCLTPPFKSFFMEYRRPPFFMHERDDLQTEEGKKRFGALRIGRTKWVRGDTSGWPVERYGVVFDSVDLHAGETFDGLAGPLMEDTATGKSVTAEHIHPNSRWVLRGTLYIKQRGMKHAEGPMAYWIGGLDERGVLLQDAVIGYPAAHHFDAEERFYWTTMLGPTFIPALRAISYMHCKNVEQQKVAPPPKLSKAYAKKNGRPLLSYRTLVIQAMTKAGGGTGQSGGGLKSHHIVRGHFADHRDKGLFGRPDLKRIFWMDAHLRGSTEVGEVIGDYQVVTR